MQKYKNLTKSVHLISVHLFIWNLALEILCDDSPLWIFLGKKIDMYYVSCVITLFSLIILGIFIILWFFLCKLRHHLEKVWILVLGILILGFILVYFSSKAVLPDMSKYNKPAGKPMNAEVQMTLKNFQRGKSKDYRYKLQRRITNCNYLHPNVFCVIFAIWIFFCYCCSDPKVTIEILVIKAVLTQQTSTYLNPVVQTV